MLTEISLKINTIRAIFKGEPKIYRNPGKIPGKVIGILLNLKKL